MIIFVSCWYRQETSITTVNGHSSKKNLANTVQSNTVGEKYYISDTYIMYLYNVSDKD